MPAWAHKASQSLLMQMGQLADESMQHMAAEGCTKASPDQFCPLLAKFRPASELIL